jgi:hypothetical protein
MEQVMCIKGKDSKGDKEACGGEGMTKFVEVIDGVLAMIKDESKPHEMEFYFSLEYLGNLKKTEVKQNG